MYRNLKKILKRTRVVLEKALLKKCEHETVTVEEAMKIKRELAEEKAIDRSTYISDIFN